MNAQDARNIMLMDVENGIRQIAMLGENRYEWKGEISDVVREILSERGFKIREQKTTVGGIKTIIQW